MSDVLVFYNNKSPAEYMTKDLQQLEGGGSVTVDFKGPYDIDEPELVLNYDKLIQGQANYCHVLSNGFYYFVDQPVLEPGGRMRVKMHIDVLMSFRAQILNMTGIIHRNSNLMNKYLTDSELPILARPYHGSRAFPQQPLAGGNAPLKWYLLVGGGVSHA